jgi:sugar phosphate isomerase/epimerase
MSFERRKFLKLTGAAGGALALNAVFANSFLASCSADDAKRIKHFGLQLWTLRDEFAKSDAKDVLRQVASFGYGHVESFDGQKGMFWGLKNTEFKKYISDLGMTIHSSHCNLDVDTDRKINEAAEIGMKYLIYPWEGPAKTIDDYKKMCDTFNKRGEACKKAGIRFAFHNHDYTFKLLEGQYAQDVLMKNTDPALVDFQMDIFWVVAAGQDPEAWMKKYQNRFRLCHVKDRAKTPEKEEGKNSVELGTGTISWSKVLKTARETGMQYYMVEQEAYPNGSPIDAIKVDAAYMKKLKA